MAADQELRPQPMGTPETSTFQKPNIYIAGHPDDQGTAERPSVPQSPQGRGTPPGGPPGSYYKVGAPGQYSPERPSHQVYDTHNPMYRIGLGLAALGGGPGAILQAQQINENALKLESHRNLFDSTYKAGNAADVVRALNGELDLHQRGYELSPERDGAAGAEGATGSVGVVGPSGGGGVGGVGGAGGVGPGGVDQPGAGGAAGAYPAPVASAGVPGGYQLPPQTQARVNAMDTQTQNLLQALANSGDPGMVGTAARLGPAFANGLINREKVFADIGKIQAETGKVGAETGKIGAETGEVQTRTAIMRRVPTPYGFMDPVTGNLYPYGAMQQPQGGGAGAPPAAPAAPAGPPGGGGAAPPLSGGALYPPQQSQPQQPSSGPIRYGPEAQERRGHAFEAPVLSDPALDTSQPIRARAQMDPRNFTHDGQGEVAKEAAQALKDARETFGGAETM
jgi:hypothetical protein